MKNHLEGMTPNQLNRLRSDWLRCVAQLAHEPDPQPENFLEAIGRVGEVADGFRIMLLLRRCYHLIIPVVSDDGNPLPLDEVISLFEPALAHLNEQVPPPKAQCPQCGRRKAKLFRQYGLGGQPSPEWVMAADLDYAHFKYSCLSFGDFNMLCGACDAAWLDGTAEDEERILTHTRSRIDSGTPWVRYLEHVRAEGVDDFDGLFALARSLPSHKTFSEFFMTALEAHDLLVPLFDYERHPRPIDDVKRDIREAEELLHEKYPQPSDKCPNCGGPGIVRFTGYPMPSLSAAERLGYAGSSGCIGSASADSRMCRACGTRWKSAVPYELKIFEYLNKRFDTKRFDHGLPSESSIDFSEMEPVGKCPQCGDKVYELEKLYVCYRAVGGDLSCRFRVGKTILQQIISVDDMRQLLTEGRTRFLKGFISNRTKRRFTASLAVGPGGKVGLEFDEKTKKKAEKAKHRR